MKKIKFLRKQYIIQFIIRKQYDSTRSYSNNTNKTKFNRIKKNLFQKQGPNGFYQQQTYRKGRNVKIILRIYEQVLKWPIHLVLISISISHKRRSKFNRVHTFMNWAEIPGKFYQERQRSQMENEIKRQQNVQYFANKEEKHKESLQNIKSGITKLMGLIYQKMNLFINIIFLSKLNNQDTFIDQQVFVFTKQNQ